MNDWLENINEAYMKELLEYYTERELILSNNINRSKAELVEVRDKLDQLRRVESRKKLLEFIRTELDGVHISDETYPIDGKWIAKIEYALRLTGRAMTQFEIMKYINAVERHKEPGPVKSVSSALSLNKQIIRSYKPKNGKGHSRYALKSWFDIKGNIEPMHDPDSINSDMMKLLNNNT